MIYHSIMIRRLPATGLPEAFLFGMCVQVHMCCVQPYKKGFVCFVLSFDKIFCSSNEFIVAGFHPFAIERTCIFYFLFADLSPTFLHFWIVFVCCPGMNNTTRPEFLAILRKVACRRIVIHFRFFLCIQVIEIAKEFVKPMIGGKHMIQI